MYNKNNDNKKISTQIYIYSTSDSPGFHLIIRKLRIFVYINIILNWQLQEHNHEVTLSFDLLHFWHKNSFSSFTKLQHLNGWKFFINRHIKDQIIKKNMKVAALPRWCKINISCAVKILQWLTFGRLDWDSKKICLCRFFKQFSGASRLS